MTQPIQMAYSQGKTCYAISVHPDNRVLDYVNKAWVAYNSGDVANYAIPYTEIFPAFYVAQYPNDFVLDVLPTETSYQQAGVTPNPTVDTPISVGQSQGSNLAAIDYSVPAAQKLSISADSMEQGIVQAGSNTVNQVVTDLTGATDDLYRGRVVIFTSGAMKRCAAIITGFNATTKVLTFTTIPTIPTPGDTLLVV